MENLEKEELAKFWTDLLKGLYEKEGIMVVSRKTFERTNFIVGAMGTLIVLYGSTKITKIILNKLKERKVKKQLKESTEKLNSKINDLQKSK